MSLNIDGAITGILSDLYKIRKFFFGLSLLATVYFSYKLGTHKIQEMKYRKALYSMNKFIYYIDNIILLAKNIDIKSSYSFDISVKENTEHMIAILQNKMRFFKQELDMINNQISPDRGNLMQNMIKSMEKFYPSLKKFLYASIKVHNGWASALQQIKYIDEDYHECHKALSRFFLRYNF